MDNYAEIRDRRARLLAKVQPTANKLIARESVSESERSEFVECERSIQEIDTALAAANHGVETRGIGHTVSERTAAEVTARRNLIGRDTHDLPDWND